MEVNHVCKESKSTLFHKNKVFKKLAAHLSDHLSDGNKQIINLYVQRFGPNEKLNFNTFNSLYIE